MRLLHYVSEQQDDWDGFIQGLTYRYNKFTFRYNIQQHQITGTTPFNLIITSSPPSPIVGKISKSAPPDMDLVQLSDAKKNPKDVGRNVLQKRQSLNVRNSRV